MLAAWLITLPAAGLVGALMWWTGHLIGGLPGVVVIFGLLLAAAGLVYHRSRRAPIDQHNVNADWDPADPQDEPRVPVRLAR